MTGARAVADEAPHVSRRSPCDIPPRRCPLPAGTLSTADMCGTISSTLTLVGRFDPETMARFVDARADLLRVCATAVSATPHRIELRIHGDPDLVGAFEAACALAPDDNVVLDLTSTERKVLP